MRIVKHFAKALIHYGGAIQGFRIFNRNSARILMYHRFPKEMEPLRQQCRHLLRHYQPISLGTFTQILHDGKSLPPNSLVITVDDGYRDFYLYGYPVFREFGIPTTVFLVSDFLDRKLWLWWDRIAYAFRNSQVATISLEWPNGESKLYQLQDANDRLSAAQSIAQALISLDNMDRLRILESIPELLQVQSPPLPPADYESLTWAEAREMASNGVELGGHTRTHPILSRITDASTLTDEIQGCKSRIEEEIENPVIHFCYPNGSTADFNEQTIEIVKQCGFLSAVTTERGMNSAQSNPFLLRRTGVEPYGDSPYFRELLAGVRAE